MPLQKLQFRPGVNREGTSLSNEGGWYECDKIRFRSGYPEKIGGWVALSYNKFLGTCRSMWNWVTLRNYNLLGVGTNLKFYVESGGVYNDITPIRLTTNNTTTFTTVLDSDVVTVSDGAVSSVQATDFVTYSNVTPVGGLDLNGEYQIQTVISATVYTIIASEPATSSATGGNGAVGGVTAEYQLNAGADTYGYGNGWGTGPWPQYNSTALSNPFATISASTDVTVTQTAHGMTTGDYVYFTGITVTVSTGTTTTITAVPNGFIAGDAVQFDSTVSLPIGMYRNTTYYVGGVISNTFVLYDTEANALAGGATGKIATSGGSVGAVTCVNVGDINGIPAAVLYKAFQVTVLTANTYSFTTIIDNLSYPATVTGSGVGGSIVAYTPSGTVRNWGEAYNSTTFGVQLRLWSQTNFGEKLLFSPRGGGIYIWEPGGSSIPAFGTRGQLVVGTDVPAYINQVMVSDSSRIVIAFGCNDYGPYGTGVIDPLLIRWSAQETYSDWTFHGDGSTQAGYYRLSHGSAIVAALQTRQEIVVWTDSAVYAMQYLGPPYVWSFTLLSDNISIASPNAMATASGVVYWMGVDKFYMYSGRVETLPCALRSFVFDDINRSQQYQFFAGTNEGYSEVWFFYCSADSQVINRYVIFNYLDRVWYYGSMGRTAWLDSALRDFPSAATYTNLIVYHEAAVDDGSTNPPSPINAYIQSSDFDIEDGHNYGFVWRMLPDITFDGSTTPYPNTPQVTFSMKPRQNPGAPYNAAPSPLVNTTQSYASRHTYTVQEFTQIIYTRVRGRQLAFRVESNSIGTQWQLGVPRMDVRPDGRRA